MKRHQFILDKLSQEKYLEVTDLCDLLNVSAVTIRKDLRFLENKGLLFRTHGGASLENPYIKERAVFEKEKISVDEKKGIALKAAELVLENDTILIASGTTVQTFAKHINSNFKLRVITSSLHVVLQLITSESIEILLLGGYIRHSSASVIGSHALDILNKVSCSKLFLGADGIDSEYGISTTSLEEAELNKEMIAASQRIVLLADSSKFGKRSFAKICQINKIDEIITDNGISKATKKRIEAKGVKITIAEAL